MKHNIYEFSIFFEDFVFRIQRILKYPHEYRRLLIGCVHYLYTIEHAMEKIAYFSW